MAGAAAVTLTAGMLAALTRQGGRPGSAGRPPAAPPGSSGSVTLPATPGAEPSPTPDQQEPLAVDPTGRVAPTAADPAADPAGRSYRVLTQEERVLHVARRLTFGPTTALLAEIRSSGADAFIAAQLEPAKIDDRACDELLAPFGTRNESAAQIDERENGLLSRPKGQAMSELRMATFVRAVHSRRQLLEVMVGFWTDHFNIWPAGDGALQAEKPVDDRTVVRPHAMGRFIDLLQASAHSPAMLRYLDNRISTADRPNENYARELLELHTVGRGNHSEDDVSSTAAVLSGWTVDDAHRFRFDPGRHADGPASVLGWSTAGTSGPRAIADGEALLGHLARHPATARHLAAKLARRFVHDDPPASLVERLAAIYLRHDTALVPVLAHLFTSPEFDDAFGAKFRRPIEFAAQVLRVTGAVVDTADPKTRTALDWRLRQMGQQPFDWPAPDGYPDVAASWLSPNDVLGRWNLSSVVAGGNLPGVTIDQRSIVEPTIGSSVADAASHVLRKLLPGSPVEPALVSALVEASGLAADDAVTAGDRRRVELMVAVALASFPAQVR